MSDARLDEPGRRTAVAAELGRDGYAVVALVGPAEGELLAVAAADLGFDALVAPDGPLGQPLARALPHLEVLAEAEVPVDRELAPAPSVVDERQATAVQLVVALGPGLSIEVVPGSHRWLPHTLRPRGSAVGCTPEVLARIRRDHVRTVVLEAGEGLVLHPATWRALPAAGEVAALAVHLASPGAVLCRVVPAGESTVRLFEVDPSFLGAVGAWPIASRRGDEVVQAPALLEGPALDALVRAGLALRAAPRRGGGPAPAPALGTSVDPGNSARSRPVDAVDLGSLDRLGCTVGHLADPDLLDRLRVAFGELGPVARQPFFTSANHLSPEAAGRVHRTVTSILAPALAIALPDHRPLLGSFLFKVARHGDPVTFHQDLSFTNERACRTTMVWLPLDDVDEASGALAVVGGSHRWSDGGRSVGRPDLHDGDLQEALADEARWVALRAGSALYYDAATVHGSLPNTSGRDRIAVGVAMVPRAADLVHLHRPGPGPEVEARLVDDRYYTEVGVLQLPDGYPIVVPWANLATTDEIRLHLPAGGR